jgi:hypothetical protein
LYSSKGQVNATRITAIATGQEDSDIVEVRARVYPTQSVDLHCDVLVNGKTYYFNYTEEKIQIFKSKYFYRIISTMNILGINFFLSFFKMSLYIVRLRMNTNLI